MWRVARRYGLALATTGIALAANRFLEPLLNEHLFILFLGAVFVSGWYGGLGPGLVSTCCSVLGIEYFFLSPVNSFRVANPDDAVRLVLFGCVALGVSALNHRLRSAEERARALAKTEQETRLRAEETTRELERELAVRRRVERRQAIQFAVTRILTEAESLEGAAPALLQAIGEGLPASFGAAWHMSSRSDALQCFAVWSAPVRPARAFEEETRRHLLAPGVGLPGRAWADGKALWVPDLTREKDFLRAPSAAEDGLRTACAFPVLRRGRSVAVLEFFSPEAHEAPEGVLSSLQDLGQRVGQFVERRQAIERLRILSEASSVLGTSLDYEATLASVARLAVPALADACVIDVVEEDGSLRRLAPVLDDPWREKLQEVFRTERLDSRTFHPVLEVVQTGKAEVLPEVSDSLLRVLAPGDDEFAAMKRGRAPVGVCVPLATRGRTLGALSLASLDPSRHYSSDEVALAEELARRCAVAVDNARLFRKTQEASEAKTRFLAAVSHDLRTPVNAIMLLASLIRRKAEGLGGSRSEELVERCRRLETASRSFTDLLTNLLDLTHLDAGEKQLRDEEFWLGDLLTETVANLGSLARAKALGLRAKPPQPDLLLKADRTELGRAMTNLVGNALKFTANGSVSVEASRDGEGRVEIAVADTGPGIPPDQLQNIFDEFYQVRNPGRDRARGSGLGLAITRRIVKALGGAMRVESVLSRGSVFTIVLPAERVVRPLGSQESPRAEPSGGPGLASILIVDDDLVSAEALAELLHEAGYRVSVAPSGEEAIRRLEEDRVDLVLLDMMMPGLDGLEIIRRIRGQPASNGLRIVAITGDVTQARVEAVHAAGADGFLGKPLEVDRLLQTIPLTLAGRADRAR
jgi:signal transduction histidine kinase/CheY-like chemotaxis protein